jgi:hypothetical protein
MKTRNGFVSNSSSSSFIVIMKNRKELSKEYLLETFGVNEKSPLYGFAEDLANWIVNNVELQSIKDLYHNYIGGSNKKNPTEDEMIEEILEDYGGVNKKLLQQIKNKEILYYEGSASNDGDTRLELMLYEGDLSIDTDEIKIYTER